jgi:DNA-binding beta-propeller fold protein YncE
MVDVHERLRDLREAPAPDLWPNVERRGPRQSPARIPWGRIGVAMLALSVAAAGVGVALRSFFGDGPERRAGPESLQGPLSNGEIVFNRSYDRGVDIWVIEPDGTNPRSLTQTETVSELAPAWSPDGRRIAFVSCTECTTSDIWIMDADGGGLRRITNDAALDGAPAWSPDGTRIAYHSGPDGESAIYLIGVDGTGRRRLSQGADIAPAWAPGGGKIAFVRFIPGIYSSLFVINSDGSGERRLTEPSIWVRQAAWSPDGKQIALAIMDVETTTNDLFVMNADGSNLTRLTEGQGIGTVTWAPDGSSILLTDAGPRHGLSTIKPDGTDLSSIYTAPKGYIHGVSWQPVPSRAGGNEPEGLRVTASVDVGGHALDVAYGGGAVWALVDPVGEGPRVVRIDPTTGQATGSVRVPPRAYRIVIGGGSVWAIHWLDDEPDRLTKIDAAGLEITGEVPLAEYLGATLATEDALWTAASLGEAESQTLLKVDVATNVVERSVPLEGTIEFVEDMAFAEMTLWLLDYRGLAKGPTPAQVVRVDAATGEIMAEIPVEGACHGPGGLGIAADPAGVWINCRTGPESFVARRIDGETNSVSASVDLPAGYSAPFSVARDGVWFVGYDTSDRGRVFLFDPTQPRIIGELVLDGLFGEVAAVDLITGSVWVARAPDQVVRLEFATSD